MARRQRGTLTRRVRRSFGGAAYSIGGRVTGRHGPAVLADGLGCDVFVCFFVGLLLRSAICCVCLGTIILSTPPDCREIRQRPDFLSAARTHLPAAAHACCATAAEVAAARLAAGASPVTALWGSKSLPSLWRGASAEDRVLPLAYTVPWPTRQSTPGPRVPEAPLWSWSTSKVFLSRGQRFFLCILFSNRFRG